MPLDRAALSAVLSDPLCAARESGQPIVAFAGNNVPVELIHASGCFPLQLPTAPRPDTTRADRYLESRFEPTTRSALELMLAGELSAARLVVLPRTSDSWQRLYYYLCELTRSFRERVPEPFLYDLLHTPFESSADYNVESTRALAEKLAAVSGKRPSDDELASSIALYDRIRDKLGQFMARRRAVPCQLAGAEALDLYTASQRLGPSVLEGVLDALLATPAAAAPGTRTLLVGSAHDTPALHQIIERAGGQVVADYHFRGDLLWGPFIH
jgi:benzoyl-CoA reductase/2-hydroxyglutaryl-CoA dehydratase subunit BcrC/BadD/HgdB